VIKYWIIDKPTLVITGPHKQGDIDNLDPMDFRAIVIRDYYDVKAQFTPEQKDELFYQLKKSHRYPQDIDKAIFWALPGNKRPARLRAAPVDVGSTLDAIYQQASEALGEPEEKLRDRYKHLGAGLQSMNLRNRMNKL